MTNTFKRSTIDERLAMTIEDFLDYNDKSNRAYFDSLSIQETENFLDVVFSG